MKIKTDKDSEKVNRRAVTFPSEGETLRGWLYFPPALKPGPKLPGIVTANALSGIKEINLPQYAERFAQTSAQRLHFLPSNLRSIPTSSVAGISMGGQHILSLTTWEPRFKAIVATSTGISNPTREAPLSLEAAKTKYDQLAVTARTEREGRAGAGIKTLQVWCPKPQERMPSTGRGGLQLVRKCLANLCACVYQGNNNAALSL